MEKNYTNYSKPYQEPEVRNEPAANINANPDPVIEDPVIDETKTEDVIGTVVKCSALNIRADASINSDIVCAVQSGTKLVVDVNNSTGEWLSVCTEAGLEGYCMSDYVKID